MLLETLNLLTVTCLSLIKHTLSVKLFDARK